MGENSENKMIEENSDKLIELDIDSLDMVTGGNLRRTVSTPTTSISKDTSSKI